MSKIVLVTNQFSVVVKGLEKKLKTLQHEVTLVESGFLGISEDNFRNDVFLIYLPDTLSVDSPKFKELNMLCEKIRNNTCGLILIGAASNHDQALKTAPLLRGVT
ncbi:MAG: hypothetical protein K6G42_05250, partial [Lachnospiraceae bacterium]|nr:hypothetical protein [Lachnospiraceae bacterium]